MRDSNWVIPFEPEEPYETNEYFNAITITYGELADGGYINWTDPKWSWNYYDEDQKARIESMIARRFWMREISIIPPEPWRMAFIEKLDEAMRTVRPVYKLLEDNPDLLVEADEWHKRRAIGSDFPATLLNGSSQDYASTGSDLEYETVRQGSVLDALEKLRGYRDPDLYILDELEDCFSKLVTVNINGF